MPHLLVTGLPLILQKSGTLMLPKNGNECARKDNYGSDEAKRCFVDYYQILLSQMCYNCKPVVTELHIYDF